MKRIMLCSGDGVCIVEVPEHIVERLEIILNDGNWLAVDECGELWLYASKPHISGLGQFRSESPHYLCDVELPKGVDWKHTMTVVRSLKDIIVE